MQASTKTLVVVSKTNWAKTYTYVLIDCFVVQICTIWEQCRRYATNQVSTKTLVFESKTKRRKRGYVRPDRLICGPDR